MRPGGLEKSRESMRNPMSSSLGGGSARRSGPPHRYRPVVRRHGAARASQQTALRVALAPVLIVALMITMWAIAFELERQARQPDLAGIHAALQEERYEEALEMLTRYRPSTFADEIDVRKARTQCFIGLDAPEQAIVQLRWLLVHDEANAAAYHRRLGDLLTELEEHEAAEVHYRQAARKEQEGTKKE